MKINYADKPDKLQNALEELNKIELFDKNLHQINQGKLKDYVDEFEMIGRIKIADQTRETHIRFKNIDDYEAYINATDQDCESEDAIFKGYNYKNNTP